MRDNADFWSVTAYFAIDRIHRKIRFDERNEIWHMPGAVDLVRKELWFARGELQSITLQTKYLSLQTMRRWFSGVGGTKNASFA